MDLGGESWNYRIFWNDRSERWQLDIWTSDEDSAGNPLKSVYGTKMVPNYPLNATHTGRIPEDGFMMLLDTGDPEAREQCTYDGLGFRWRFSWVAWDGLDDPEDRNWSITVP